MMIIRLVQTMAFLFLLAVTADGAMAAGGFITTGKGVQYRDLQAGSGEHAEAGDVATIHFVGWLDQQGKQGTQVYNTRGRRGPISFVIGTDRVMQGWNEGVIGMQPGGRRLVRIPASAAYGGRGVQGVIPPNAGLIFTIDLLSLEKGRP